VSKSPAAGLGRDPARQIIDLAARGAAGAVMSQGPRTSCSRFRPHGGDLCRAAVRARRLTRRADRGEIGMLMAASA